jgi:hypothetical protein
MRFLASFFGFREYMYMILLFLEFGQVFSMLALIYLIVRC